MIDKMIEEIEELKWQAEKDMELSDTVEEANYYGGLNDAYEKSIEIAEKYKADKCKWKYMKNKYSGFVFESCNGKKFADLHNFKYCPYCGKEIEVDD